MRGGRAGDPGGPPALGIRAGASSGAGAASALDDRQGVAPARLLAPAAAAGGRARCARRYERERPGELLHVDTKRLGRFWEPGKRVLGAEAGRPHRNRRVGWQHLHVAIDDHSRLAYAELLPGQDAESCVGFLERACAWYRDHGVEIERLLTDNARAYHSRAWLKATARLGIQRRYTRIYRPRTNGKAERFIQTLLVEWAYARSYPSSAARARAFPGYLRWYNRRRPHSSLGARPPISRVSHLCGHDS